MEEQAQAADAVIPCECGRIWSNRIDRGRGMTMYPLSRSSNKAEFKTAYKCRECGSKWEM